MKLHAIYISCIALLILASCSNTANFTVTNAAPETEIKAKTRVDEDNNKVLTINAKNLDSPESIDSSSRAYVVWIKTDENELRNLGELHSNNEETATFKAETRYEFSEILITAESRANVSEPTGTEIAKVEIPEYMVAPIPDAPAPDPYQSDTGSFSQPGIPNPYDTLRIH